MALPENRILRHSMLVATIALVWAYAWLGARILEPRFELPSEIVAAAAWVEGDDVRILSEMRSSRWREIARIERETSIALDALRWVGGETLSLEPVELVVRADDVERLVVTDSRIEIGSDVLLAKGQLTKAFLKAYLLQKGSIDLVSSHLRLDVVSDVLLAISTGGLGLEVPGRPVVLKYEAIRPWWSYARTYRGVCESDWRSVELSPICRARDPKRSVVSALSFRPLIGAVLVEAFQSQPVATRYEFARKWVRSLERLVAAKSPSGTREKIASEIESLMPLVEFTEVADSLRSSLAAAQILDSTPIEADLVIHAATIGSREIESVANLLKSRPRMVVFGRSSEGLVAFPGGVLLGKNDVTIGRVKHEVLRSCASPKLLEIADRDVPTKRLIWVKTCEPQPKALDYAPLVSIGVEGFARSNAGVTFIQLKPEGVAFALRSGRASPIEGAEALLKSESAKKGPWFGLASSAWIDSAHAFRVNGAIEAVEWHRTAKAEETE